MLKKYNLKMYLFFIAVNEFGNITDERFVQYWNIPLPVSKTVDGISIVCNASQYSKA